MPLSNFCEGTWGKEILFKFSTKLISLRKKLFFYGEKKKNVIKSESWHSRLINLTMKTVSLTSIIYWQGKMISYFDLKHVRSSTKIFLIDKEFFYVGFREMTENQQLISIVFHQLYTQSTSYNWDWCISNQNVKWVLMSG
jgi:hypothetical protein